MTETQPESRLEATTDHIGKTVSRREFLKLSAVAAAGGALLAVPPLPFRVNSKHPLVDAGDVPDDALGVCSKSPLYLQAIQDLGIFGYQFTCSVDTVGHTSIQESLLGAVLRPIKVRDPRMGAAISLTFDLQERELNVLEYVVVWCLLDMTNAISVSFDRWKPLYAEMRSQRVEYTETPRMIRPSNENRWAFVRENPLPLLPGDLMMEGWPAIVSERKFWFFGGSSHTEWANREGISFYRCTQIAEYLSASQDQSKAEQYRYIDLSILQ